MLFTFIDLRARKRAETALRESERFEALKLAPVPTAVCEGDSLRDAGLQRCLCGGHGLSLETSTGEDDRHIDLRPDMAASLERRRSAHPAIPLSPDSGRLV